MRGNNQRKFFILVISSPCLVSHGRALLCLQHSPSQFSSLEMEPHHCTLCAATATFPEPAWIFFAFTFKQLIFKARQRCSSSPSKINRYQSFPLSGLTQSTLP